MRDISENENDTEVHFNGERQAYMKQQKRKLGKRQHSEGSQQSFMISTEINIKGATEENDLDSTRQSHSHSNITNDLC